LEQVVKCHEWAVTVIAVCESTACLRWLV